MGTPDAGVADAGMARCDGGPCVATLLNGVWGAHQVVLDVAYLGLEPGDAGTFLYVEAYRGAAAGCPEMSSPTPDQTLIVSGIPVSAPGTVLTHSDGVHVTLLDFRGDLFMSAAPQRASTVALNVRDVEAAPDRAFVVVELSATFADAGTVTGIFAATHCTSLDN